MKQRKRPRMMNEISESSARTQFKIASINSLCQAPPNKDAEADKTLDSPSTRCLEFAG